jgi:RNA-directed DNA polymerase
VKRIGNLWPQVIGFNNLLQAYYQARKGKQNRDAVASFGLELEAELFQLQQELLEGTYRPGQYRQFVIRERKPRLISAAPFRDRVVHHALMNVLAPVLEKRFYHHSYACRPGKGVHKAVDQYQHWAQRYTYVMKVDVARYFPSIHHEVLRGQLECIVKCRPTLALLEAIIDNGPAEVPGVGLPIGNLTSQYFANLYLNDIDYWLKQELGVPAYLRYVDDLVLLADSKACLWGYRDQLHKQLVELGLSLHPSKQQVMLTHERVDMLGYNASRERRWLRNDNGYRFQRKYKKLLLGLQQGHITFAEVQSRVASWIGHAQHGETQGLRQRLFSY